MDTRALRQLSYGLYVVTTVCDGKMNGQIADAVMQITGGERPTVAVSLNNNNYTRELAAKSRLLGISVLADGMDRDLIAHFGMQSGRDIDKFAAYPPDGVDEQGVPYFTDRRFCAWMTGRVIEEMPMGTHTIFVLEITEGETLCGKPLIYADYLAAKRAPEPAKKAAKGGMRCTVCGHIEYGEMGPDYKCPLCGMGPEVFEPVAAEAEPEVTPAGQTGGGMRCTLCGYVEQGEMGPDYQCPVCGMGREVFEPVG